MTDATAFAFAAARMQARYGARPTDATWRQFSRIGDCAHLLQTVRGTALAPWVADLTDDAGAHRIEAALRWRYRLEVREVARWVPASWRSACAWAAWLPDLSAAAHVRRGRATYGWMADDPVAAALTGRDDERSADVAAFAALAGAPDDGRPLVEHWLDTWRARCPPIQPAHHAGVERVHRQARRLLGVAAGGERERSPVEPSLRRVFRRHAREPAGALAYLALLYIQFTRLRGALARRRLFRPAG